MRITFSLFCFMTLLGMTAIANAVPIGETRQILSPSTATESENPLYDIDSTSLELISTNLQIIGISPQVRGEVLTLRLSLTPPSAQLVRDYRTAEQYLASGRSGLTHYSLDQWQYSNWINDHNSHPADPTPVPEPSTFVLLFMVIFGAAGFISYSKSRT